MAFNLGVNIDLTGVKVLEKFGRNYVLNIGTNDGNTLTVKPPFTIEFDVTRNTLTSANVSSIRIYNLNSNNRSRIRKNVNDFGDIRQIQLLAGYGKNLSLIFDGNITQAWSVREGTNFITQIESFDGGFAFANAYSNVSFPSGTAQQTVVSTLIKDLNNFSVAPGLVSPSAFGGSLSRGNAYSGNTCNLLQSITGGLFFIDNGKAYALSDNECVGGAVTTISPASGLLDTPIREQTIITANMLFEPKLVMSQQVTLRSFTADTGINGNWKVVSIKHRGMISESVAGSATTTVQLLQPLGSQGLSVLGVA